MLSIFANRAEARRWAKAVNKNRPKHDRVGVPQRPLKPKTQDRLAGGLLKWVLDSAWPFILNIENYGWNSSANGRSIDEPLSTVTAGPKGGKHAAVDVEVAGYTGVFNHGGHDHRTQDARAPMSTVTGARDARGAVTVEFTVGVSGRAGQSPATSIDAPMPTVTGKADRVVACVQFNTANGKFDSSPSRVNTADASVGAITGTQKHAIAAVHLSTYHGAKDGETRGQVLNQPISTLDTQNRYGVVAAEVAPYSIGTGGPAYSGKPKPADVPFNTVTADDRKALVAVALNKHYTGVVGQAADEPLGTVTGVDHNSILAAHLVKFRGQSPGTSAGEPMDTITAGGNAARDAGAAHAMGAAAVYLSHMYTSNTCGGEGDPAKPAKTVTSGGHHGAVTVVYLAAYYGEGSGKTGHTPAEPAPTIVSQGRFALASVETTPHWVFTTKALARARQVANWARKRLGKKVAKHLLWVTDEAGKRFALLMLALEGAIHIVTDIAMRMLRPRELARAQGFSDSYVIDHYVDRATGKVVWVKKADQVKLIGNSVCEQVMDAIAYLNVVMQGVLDYTRGAVLT